MVYDPVHQIFFLASWLLILKILQMSLNVTLRPLLSSYSAPVSYPLSLLIYTFLSMYAVSLSLPWWSAFIPFLILIIFAIMKRNVKIPDIRDDLMYDGIFALFFLFSLEFRIINPVITHFSEQFMDHAFMISIMRNPVIPPLDPWFSGGDLTIYYYAGHWMFSMVSLLSQVPSSVGFNLILPTIFGLSAVSLLMIGRLGLKKLTCLPLVSLVLVNPSLIYYLFSGQSIWVALNNTRFNVPGCATEYPLFSLFLGDAHANVLDLFNQFFLLSVLLYTLTCWKDSCKMKQWVLMSIIGLSLGFMRVCNSWDFLVYSPLVFIAGILLLLRSSDKSVVSCITVLFVPLVASVLFWIPCIIHMDSSSFNGIVPASQSITSGQTILWVGIFILLFLIFLRKEFVISPYLFSIPLVILSLQLYTIALLSLPLIVLLSHLYRTRFETETLFPDILGIFGFLTLMFCSAFQINLDSQTNFMNTVFRFGYVAWIMLSVSVFLYIGTIFEKRDWSLNSNTRYLSCLCVVFLFLFPVVAQVDLAKNLVGMSFPDGYNTLDGSAYLTAIHPDDEKAIRFAYNLTPGTHILEGIGGDYSYSAPVSTFTGTQTVMGKYSHEFQWRGSRYGWLPNRLDDVKSMYEDPEIAATLLRNYNISYVYVGGIERSLYNVSIDTSYLKEIWRANDSVIYRVNTNTGDRR